MKEAEICIEDHAFPISEEKSSIYERGGKILGTCKHCGLSIGFSKSFFPKYDPCVVRSLARIMGT